MAPKLVNTQGFSTGGDEQFGTEIDATGFQVDDFLVIALMTVASGGGYTYYNKFSGTNSKFSKVSGFFGDSTDILGHTDANMVNGGLATAIFRHKVTSADLVDTGGGQGTLTAIAWQKGANPSPYPAALVCWQMRGVTYSSKASNAVNDFAPFAADPETVACAFTTMTKYQAYFSAGVSVGNGYSYPTTYAHSISDNGAAPDFSPLTFAQEDWTYVALSNNNGSDFCANSSFGKLADASGITVTWGASGDTSANADFCNVVVTFVEDLTPKIVTDSWGMTG